MSLIYLVMAIGVLVIELLVCCVSLLRFMMIKIKGEI
jgi:hypothetical protein